MRHLPITVREVTKVGADAGRSTDAPHRVSEQPNKIVFVAAAALYANKDRPELVAELLLKTGTLTQQYVDAGDWRRFKLMMRFLACLQGIFNDDGVFSVLEELFQRTIDLQTASPEDVRLSKKHVP